MFPGGIADKLGNRYEAKWLVCQFFDVILGKYHWLRFEAIVPEYDGFEFAVGTETATEWHQTKRTSPKGNWTINSLQREGVLPAFARRFRANDSDTCNFISEDPAKDMSVLSDKALIATDVDEFLTGLSEDQGHKFADLYSNWGVEKDIAWTWLRRSKWVVQPQSGMESIINLHTQRIFEHTNGEALFASLRDYAEKRFNKVLTTELLREELVKVKGLVLKEWSLDPTLRQKLRKETDAYLSTYSPFGVGGATIVRAETRQIHEALCDPDGSHILLATGIAGSGKSGVVRGLIERLQEDEIAHLAFRVDHHLECKKPEDFGRALLDRNENPVVTMKGVSPEKTSVLIVDQVDAVSEVSGRNGVVKAAILRMLDGLYALETVRVVLVCRSFDFDNDARLKTLRERHRENRIEIPLLDWGKDIEPVLEAKGHDLARFSASQKELLRLPLNLAVYLEIAETDLQFASRDDLFDALVRKKDRDIRRDRTITWSMMEVLQVLAGWMSDRQRLEAPVSVLDRYSGARDILASEHLIITHRDRANFFHESFFDFAYARAFIVTSQSLHELLLSTEQHLFRRTQCRQILEVMRHQDFARYLCSLEQILLGDDIRFHVKTAIAKWLGSISDPTPAERAIAIKLDDNLDNFALLARQSLFGSPGWFDLHSKTSWIVDSLEGASDARRNTTFWWLSAIVGERPFEITTILRTWWGQDPERGSRLLDWFNVIRKVKPTADLEQLCEDVIRSKPPTLFPKDAANSRNMFLVTLVGENSEQGSRILRAFFDTWFELHPGEHPFTHNHLKNFDLHSLGQLAKKAHMAYVGGVIGAFLKSLEIIKAREECGERDYTFRTLTYSGHLMGDDKFLDQFRTAMRKIAETDPDRALAYLKQLHSHIHPVSLHIHLNTVLGNPQALASHFMTLLADNNLFDSGWQGAAWKSFADAANAVFAFLKSDQQKRVEDIVLSHEPERERAIRIAKKIKAKGESDGCHRRADVISNLNFAGYKQLCILETIGIGQLSAHARHRYLALRRKLPNVSIEKPWHNEMQHVGSPIKRNQAVKMSDEQWLSAIEKYNDEHSRTRGHDFIDGGARQLSSELKHCAANDPERFVALMQRVPENANPVYIQSILSALAERDEIGHETLHAAIVDAHNRVGQPFGEQVAGIIARSSELARDQTIFDLLVWYSEYGEATEHVDSEQTQSELKTVTVNQLSQHVHGTHARGARAEAAVALEQVAWNVPERVEDIRTVLCERIKSEPLIGVRCALMTPLTPLYNHGREACAQMVEELVSAYSKSDTHLPPPSTHELSPLIAVRGSRLLPYLVDGVPEIGIRLVRRLKEEGDEIMQLIAAWYVLQASFFDASFVEEADALLGDEKGYCQLAADTVSRMISVVEDQGRAKSLLLRFFDDPDEGVRKNASKAFGRIKPQEAARYDDLIRAYLDSAAFDGDDYSFFEFLKNAQIPVYEYVILAAEKVISQRPQEVGSHWRFRDFHHLNTLIKIEYAASENDPDLRRRLLDIIDLFIEYEVYGTDEVVAIHDRAA